MQLTGAPRAALLASPALLLRLRSAAARSGASQACGEAAGAAWIPAPRQRRSRQASSRPPPTAQAAAAADAGRAPGRRGSKGSGMVDPHRLMGFTAVDVTDPKAPTEIGIVDDVSERGGGGSCAATLAAVMPFVAVPPQSRPLLNSTTTPPSPSPLSSAPQVLTVAETGQAQALLHVRAPAAPGLAADMPRQEHLVPFVPQIVPRWDLATGGWAVGVRIRSGLGSA